MSPNVLFTDKGEGERGEWTPNHLKTRSGGAETGREPFVLVQVAGPRLHPSLPVYTVSEPTENDRITLNYVMETGPGGKR